MISIELKVRFEKIIEINDINWSVIDNIVKKDANILRPIKGIAFEEYLKKIIKRYDKNILISDGLGDSDIDLFINNVAVQVKTPIVKGTIKGQKIKVALHKTHGNETRPNNLYSSDEQTFDVLCVQHPEAGILIVPFSKIPHHKKWNNRFADPVCFEWNSEWINRWDLLKIDLDKEINLDQRIVPDNSVLPYISSQTWLDDFEIIEMLCKPEYFRAAVMGLKGNLKEELFIDYLRQKDYFIDDNIPTYEPYDIKVRSSRGEFKVQIKGTSKNMCSIMKKEIGTEVMGTHGQFPMRGYKKSSIDYIAIIISQSQLPKHDAVKNINFIIVPSKDLPMHYLIGNGQENKETGYGNKKWNLPEFSDVIYPNIKFNWLIENENIILVPNISGYGRNNGYDIIPIDSEFRKNKKYILNHIPLEWESV